MKRYIDSYFNNQWWLKKLLILRLLFFLEMLFSNLVVIKYKIYKFFVYFYILPWIVFTFHQVFNIFIKHNP